MRIKNRKSGFTLVEMMVGVVLVAIVFLIGIRIFTSMNQSVGAAQEQVDIGSQTRYLSELVNNAVRFSDTVFTVPTKSFVDEKLTKGWSYVGLKENVNVPATLTRSGKPLITQALVQVNYVGSTLPAGTVLNADEREINNEDGCFVERIIGFSELDPSTKSQVKYTLQFERSDPTNRNEATPALRYVFYATVHDEAGNVIENSKGIDVDTMINGVNNSQIFFRGSLENPPTALAYHEADYAAITTSQMAANVVFVCDLSDSMYRTILGPSSGDRKRSEAMYTAATAFFKELDSSSVDIEMIGFADLAYSGGRFKGNQITQLDELLKKWATPRSMSWQLGLTTNLGDGLRGAYFALQDMKHNGKPNYIIILSDGASNMYRKSSSTSGGFSWDSSMLDGDVYKYLISDENDFDLVYPPAAPPGAAFLYRRNGPNYASWVASKIAAEASSTPTTVFSLNLAVEEIDSVYIDLIEAEFSGKIKTTPTNGSDKYKRQYYPMPPMYNRTGRGVPVTTFNIGSDEQFKEAFKKIADAIAKEEWLVNGPKV